MNKQKIVILTGAGISAESGIQTFRDSDGLWEQHHIEDVATFEGFQHNPQLVQQFYNDRRRQIQQPTIQPNAAHYALAKLEDEVGDRLLLVTQNIDNLHENAGNHNILHMHGELLKVRCLKSEHIYPWEQDLWVSDRCQCCTPAQPLRPHIVWFGEIPLHMDEIYLALSQAAYFISIGTSGNVYPAASFVQIANQTQTKTIELNLEPSLTESQFDEKIYGKATDIVPQYIEKLITILKNNQ